MPTPQWLFDIKNTEVYRSGHGNAHGVPIMPTPQWLFDIKNTEVYRSGHGNAHGVPFMPTSQWLFNIKIRKCIEVVITARTRNAVTG